MSDEGRPLGKVKTADVTLVGPDLSVAEYVLVKVTLGRKILVADWTNNTRTMLGLVIHELKGTRKGLTTLVTGELFNVSHQMIF